VRVVCREGGPFRWPIHSPAYFRGRGGGVLLDIGVHALDLLTWWLGQPEEVGYADDAMGGVEANCSIHLRVPGGSAAEVRLSRDTAQPNRYAFRGDRGWLTWNVHEPDGLRLGLHDAGHALDARLREVRGGRDVPELGGSAGDFLEAFAAQLRNAVDAARGTGHAAVTGREALRTARLLEECRAHRSLLPMPWLSEAERREALRRGGEAR
jgi:predicted dehydrogenase